MWPTRATACVLFMQKPCSMHLLCADPSGKHKRSFCPVGEKVCSLSKVEGERPKGPDGGDSFRS